MTEVYYIVRDKDSFWVNYENYICLTTNEVLSNSDVAKLVEGTVSHLLGFNAEKLRISNMTITDFKYNRLWTVPENAMEEDKKSHKSLKLCILDVENGHDVITSCWSTGKNDDEYGMELLENMKVHASLFFELK